MARPDAVTAEIHEEPGMHACTVCAVSQLPSDPSGPEIELWTGTPSACGDRGVVWSGKKGSGAMEVPGLIAQFEKEAVITFDKEALPGLLDAAEIVREDVLPCVMRGTRDR